MVLGYPDQVVEQGRSHADVSIGALLAGDGKGEARHAQGVGKIVGGVPGLGLGGDVGFETGCEGRKPGMGVQL